ncbi:hypothetical protein [Clostridium sp. WB02_MRS01]|uniref:hypothetical protein n=1 Tax=Clostridium sp. WB02_MRS01 TaxID=2605777 RepID=UPI0012B2A5C1|nr:hypothetical protein [Clostridium sp. WB02_MRS01]
MSGRGAWACIYGSTCTVAEDKPEFCNMYDCPKYQVRESLKGNPIYDLKTINETNRRKK